MRKIGIGLNWQGAFSLSEAVEQANVADDSGVDHLMVAEAWGRDAVTTMAIAARRHDIPFASAVFALEKHMRADPRRVEQVPLQIRMPAGLDEAQRAVLERAARECPVALSLHPEVGKEIRFEYPD